MRVMYSKWSRCITKWLCGTQWEKIIQSRRIIKWLRGEYTSFYWNPVYEFYMDVQAYLVLFEFIYWLRTA